MRRDSWLGGAAGRALLPTLAVWLLGFVPSLVPHAHAATITVTNSNDQTSIGDGVSLREAILSINAGADFNADVSALGPYGTNDTILFNIPGIGVQTINPTSSLPSIANPVLIDGYSQPGASANSEPLGDNAVILIELDGSELSGSVDGLAVTAGGCRIQGLVINDFPGNGISLQGAGADVVAGNFIGTNASGTQSKPNSANGILDGALANTIGGEIAARNLISGNILDGISLGSAASTIQGNFVGSDITGSRTIGNRNGISVTDLAADVVVGGPTSSPGLPPGNLISGNQENGIKAEVLVGGLAQVLVSGNLIGTTVDGMQPLGNLGDGILLAGSRTSIIGGSSAPLRNIISGNFNGVHITSVFPVSFDNVVEGNYIGTNILGTAPIPNSCGVHLDTTESNVIGGTQPGQRNVVSGNAFYGIALDYFPPFENRIIGNFIGTDPSGSFAVPNGIGIAIIDAHDNAIGEPGAGNTIAFNGGPGVLDVGFNAVRGNAIFANGGLGIDGGLGLPNPNVPCGEENIPVLLTATGGGERTRIQGTLNSKFPLSILDFYANSSCDPSGYGEGQRYLGSTALTTSVGCDAIFDVTVSGRMSPGEVVTATATNEFNTTSQFSACVPVQGLAFFTVTPCRVADTRVAAGGNGAPSLAANSDRVFSIGGQCAIPPSAQVVAFNFAVTGSSAPGNLRVTGSGPGPGATSTLYYSAGQTRANNAILALDPDGNIDIHVAQDFGKVDLIIDVTGYFR